MECWWYPFFCWKLSRLRIQKVPHVNSDSIPVAIIQPFLIEMRQLLVAETDKYEYDQQTHLTGQQTQLTDIIVQEISDFGCNNETWIWRHGHIQRLYRSTLDHFCIPFYSNTLKYYLFLHALRFVHESMNSMNQPDKNYDKLGKQISLGYDD